MNIELYFYNKCIEAGMTMEGACSLMAQIKRESGFNPKNLENAANSRLGLSDEQYTEMVDNGTYTAFTTDGAGYGLAQHTFSKRKEWMLEFARAYGSSIGDYRMQTDFIIWELKNKYRAIWEQLTTSHDLKSLTWLLLDTWENPAEKTDNMSKRFSYAQSYLAAARDLEASVTDEATTSELEIPKNVVEEYVQYAVYLADDNSHGYSQANRWGPDYDCSSMVITCVQAAGIPVKDAGATYTGNMRRAFLACGFGDVTSSCNLASGAGMVRGDILLNDVNHTAIYLGNGRIVHARSSEGNSIQGDQSGNEIRTQAYYNYPWDAVLRYTKQSGTSSGGQSTVQQPASAQTIPILKKGSKGANVKTMQEKLIELGYDVGPYGADGDFGNATFMALVQFQQEHGLEADGEFGPITYAAMKSAKPKTGASAVPGTALAVKSIVRFTGDRYYRSATTTNYVDCKPGKARITRITKGAKHPYYIVAMVGGGSTVRGWVNEKDIEVWDG